MILDLHSHFPMHIAAGDGALDAMLRTNRSSLRDRARAMILRAACKIADYEGANATPSVTLDSLRGSGVRAVLSVLYVPFDEMDFSVKYAAPPRPVYIEDLHKLMRDVESVVSQQNDVVVAREPADIDNAIATNRIAIVHCIEGGFHLGDNDVAVRANVETLADLGVAYITVAHLFWRQVATNAPALPFLPDGTYSTLFPQPATGLAPLGVSALRAMVANGILVDVTHMSARSFEDTMRLLEEIDPDYKVPVLASHGACKLDDLQYNLDDAQIKQIARRRGVIGLIACEHYIAGKNKPKNLEESVNALCKHIDRIHLVTGSHDFTALGSDQDGFIKPSLKGLETPPGLGKIEALLATRYDPAVARKICWENGRRVLGSWRTRV